LNIIFIGDIFGQAGREMVGRELPRLIRERKADLVIANGENAAGGFGITVSIAETLFELGIDVITSGNHIWDKREIYDYFPKQPKLLRPGNYPEGAPGSGLVITKSKSGIPCAVINLQGRSLMQPIDCPFRKADQYLSEISEVKVRFVDFHAEATSEKVAMGWHLDGKVSAVIGTHTHIPTADTRILPGGTAYQTDSGMTGPYDSVIGVEKEGILRKFMNGLPLRMEPALHGAELRGVFIRVDETSGKAVNIERITVD
jgi:2',3'-cyclic-nucleotide 2'-phosphodiesterase